MSIRKPSRIGEVLGNLSYSPAKQYIQSQMYYVKSVYFPRGRLTSILFTCTPHGVGDNCWIEVYSSNSNPEVFTIWDRHICRRHHLEASKSYMSWTLPVRGTHHYYYFECQECGFPLVEGEDISLDGDELNHVLESCPICDSTVDRADVEFHHNKYLADAADPF